ncbi:MAG: hypothetical protein ACREOK_14035 [Gemmatimonadaceae bacterium]
MSELRRYFAEIGRKGGTRSRRALDSGTARRMVAIREARRAALRAAGTSVSLPGTPSDTSAAAQAVQDALWRRASPSEKLTQVARVFRMVERLSIAGLRQRHPADGERELLYRRAEARLGPELASRVYGAGEASSRPGTRLASELT